ncbi:hypothetical protein ABT081_02560 [Streptomyces sp. NPDC002238]|uniref:hypothetical protein n=1 Tax=Streptomyces sp. NPDC002238 TaxID=3156649 RepID=UPI003331D6A5
MDDGAHSHPKIMKAKNAAVGLWTRVGSYVAQHLTDGHVPGEVAKSYGSAPQIKRLIEVGLWHAHGHTCPRCPEVPLGDYYMHDYAESRNPTRAEVLASRKRAADKKRQQRGGAPAGRRRPPAPDRGQPRLDDEPPPDDEDAPPEDHTPPARTPRPAAAAIAPDWEPSPEDVHAAQVARRDAGRPPLTADQVDAVTRKFVRRQLDDDARAAAWGGRWRQWAETERPDQPTGGVVVPFGRGPSGGQQSTADQRAAAAFALAEQLRAEGNQ